MPTSGRFSETNPSLAISWANPKCLIRNSADARSSETFSETAEDVTFTCYCRACTFAHVSLSVSVRLKTSCPGRESGSGAK